VGTHQDPVQRAIIGVLAVMGTLLNGAFDALVCVVSHNCPSFVRDVDSMLRFFTLIRDFGRCFRLTFSVFVCIMYSENFGFPNK